MSARLMGAVAVATIAAGCGNNSPTAPTPQASVVPPVVVTTPTPRTYTLNGTVVATNGGFRLPNITVGFNNLATEQFTADGSFRVSFSTPAVYLLTLNGPGIVPRSLRVPIMEDVSRQIDAISVSGGFDLAFYRQFVRNGFEQPSNLLPIRRQLEAPRIYLRTIDDSGAPIDALTLNGTAVALEQVTGSLTGRFGLAGIERGTDTKQGQPGWITVRWSTAASTHCGQAIVGGDLLTLFPRSSCRCVGGPAVNPLVVKHEMGHALGFWHTDSLNDLMHNGGHQVCDMNPSAREMYHAAIAYSRPIGNRDPDIDP